MSLCATALFSMIVVSLGFCADPPNKIKKTYTAGQSYNINLKDGCSTRNPVLLLAAADLAAVQKYNYGYIEEWGKYYNITDVVSVRQGLIEIHMSLDLLKTYQADILSSKGFLRRSETNYNLYFPDTSFGELAYKTTDLKNVGSNLSNDCYIAIIVGE